MLKGGMRSSARGLHRLYCCYLSQKGKESSDYLQQVGAGLRREHGGPGASQRCDGAAASAQRPRASRCPQGGQHRLCMSAEGATQ